MQLIQNHQIKKYHHPNHYQFLCVYVHKCKRLSSRSNFCLFLVCNITFGCIYEIL